MASLAAVNEQLQINNENNMVGHELTGSAIEKLNGTMNGFINMMKMQNLDMLEMMRERGSGGGGDAAATSKEAAPQRGGLFKVIAGILALAIGFFQGIGDSIKKLLNLARLDKPLMRIFDSIVDFFKAIGRSIRGGSSRAFKPVADAIDDTVKIFKDIGKFLKNSFAGRLMAGITDFIKFPLEGLVGTGKGGGMLARIGSAITAPFRILADTVRSVFAFAAEGSGLMKTLGTVGRVIGRLFAPFAVIITLYDTVKGVVDGFRDDGFIGAVFGGIEGLANSVIGMPLDLLKSVVAWLLDKFGFDNTAEALRGFSFTDIISSMVMAVKNTIKSIINVLIEGLATLVGTISSDAADKIRGFKFEEDAGPASAEDIQLAESDMEKKRRVAEEAAQAVSKARARGAPKYRLQRLEAKSQEALLDFGESRDNVAELKASREALDDTQTTTSANVMAPVTVTDNSSQASTTFVGQMSPSVDVNDPRRQAGLGF